jgi:hypothetical protein
MSSSKISLNVSVPGQPSLLGWCSDFPSKFQGSVGPHEIVMAMTEEPGVAFIGKLGRAEPAETAAG